MHACNPHFGGANCVAQESQETATAKVQFVPSSDGKTLTISGQGDLTTLTTDYSTTVFSDKAVGYVFTDENGTSVNASDAYNANKPYYKGIYEYSQIFDGGMPTNGDYVYNVSTITTWNDDATQGHLWVGYANYDFTQITLEQKIASASSNLDKINQSWKLGENVYSFYFWVTDAEASYAYHNFSLSKDVEGLTYYGDAGIKLLSPSDLKKYYRTTTTYYCSEKNSVFVAKSENGEKTALVGGQQYTYEVGDLFYTGTATYAKIENNSEFFSNEHTDYLTVNTETVDFATMLHQEIVNGTYETVEFENTSTSDKLLINSAIISKILFSVEGTYGEGNTYTNHNPNLVNLDLGEATCVDLSSNTFSTDGHNGTPSLTTLTLPLVNPTKEYSASEGKEVEKVVVPSNVLGNYYTDITTVTIPEGYDRIGTSAFENRTKITTFNLPRSLTLIGDKAFYTCTALASIELNEGLQNIGKEAFEGTNITSIKFPSSLKIIDDAAFFECKIFDIKLNAGLKYIGNSAFALKGNATSNGETTLEIPASVRYIGPFAFAVHYYQDVFFYGNRAPIMPSGKTPYIQDQGIGTAFSENTYMGNNGFNEGKEWKEGVPYDDAYKQGYANRENYKNGNVYFTMLHFPKDLTDAERACYTDITRVYKTTKVGCPI